MGLEWPSIPAPIVTGVNTMNCGLCVAVNKWLKQPFREDGSALNWFLFLGLALVAVFFWTRILKRVAP